MNETRDQWEAKLAQARKDGDQFAERQAESKLAEIDDAAKAQEREQRQQAEVERIALPRDYDEYYNAPGLNDVIQALLRQVIEAKNAEHNVEIAGLLEANRKRAEADAAVIAEMRKNLDEVTGEHFMLGVENADLKKSLHEVGEARADAEKKRDNAVRIAEEAQEATRKAEQESERLRAENASLLSQIDELEDNLRRYKSPEKPVIGGITLTDTLPSLSEEELKARRKREETERLNRLLAEKYGDTIKPLDVPPLPSTEKAAEPVEEEVTEEAIKEQLQRVSEAAEADARTFQVAQNNAGKDEAEGGAEAACEDARGADAEETPTLAQRVEVLEDWKLSVERKLRELGYSVYA